MLEPVGVHLPEAGVVCSGRPPTHDVRLLSCTSYYSLHTLQQLFSPLLVLKVSMRLKFYAVTAVTELSQTSS